MKKWKTLNKLKVKSDPFDKTQGHPERSRMDEKLKVNEVIKILLENRGLKTKKEIDEFLNPKLEDITIKNVGIDNKQLQKAIERIRKAIKNKERIVVFGDYDVDGICGTAILWETLNSLGARAMPYIPHRVEEGYGLSIKGIQNVITSSHPELGSGSRFRNKFGMTNNQVQHDNERGLIITVDNGIVANAAVEFANKQGIDVIITDHHVPSNPSTGSGLPKAFAIVHTTKLCGTGVAYLLARSVWGVARGKEATNYELLATSHLELVALATVADLVPLVGANRTLLKFGLQQLRKTQRIGLKAVFQEAGIEQDKLGVYEIGHVIAPRLNAMGRLDYAMDSLRLLCTKNGERARMLAKT